MIWMLRRQIGRSIDRALLIGIFFALTTSGQTVSPAPRTIWDGVYNQSQQERGSSSYTVFCGRCHGEDLSGTRAVLRNPKFLERWREDNLGSLYTLIRNTMPPGPREVVQSSEYLDIIAYILSTNQFPVGNSELTLKELEQIAIVAKEGPKPVPDFALVTVVGCLTAGENNRWTLNGASEPVRTRNPRESAAAELAAATARSGGSHTFGLLDTVNFPAELRARRWMEAKGFLIRAPGDDRINLTWLHTLRDTCEIAGAR